MRNDQGDTFLTDMLMKGKPKTKRADASSTVKKPPMSSKGSVRAGTEMKKKVNDAKAPNADLTEIDSEEYRDMVFDIEDSKDLLH